MHTNMTDRTPLHAVHYCNNTKTLSTHQPTQVARSIILFLKSSIGRFNRLLVDATDRALPLIGDKDTELGKCLIQVLQSLINLIV